MSEREFDLYLSLLAKFLKLRPGQRGEIADELRDHLEQRLEELSARGMTRDEAIRAALEEFGDAAELANHFTHISRIRRRRLIMRTTAGTIAALVVVLLLTNAFWPNMPAAPAPARVIAQQQVESGKEQKAVGLPSNAKLDLRAAVEHKLSGALEKGAFDNTPLKDALKFLADAANVDILIDHRGLTNEGVADDAPVNLSITKTRVTIRTALELILEQHDLSYRIRDGLIQVTTLTRVQEENEVVVYNVRDLITERTTTVADDESENVRKLKAAIRKAYPTSGSAVRILEVGNAVLLQGVLANTDQEGGILQMAEQLFPKVINNIRVQRNSGGFGGGSAVGGDGLGGSADVYFSYSNVDSLLDVITTAVEPDSWDTVGGAGTICEYDGLLVVRNTQAVQEKVRQLLDQLRIAAKEAAR